MTTDIFAKTDGDITPTEFKLEDLVGEDKKYKTPEDLVKAVYEKDRFIKQLETEGAGLREELDKRVNTESKLDQLMDQLKQSREAPSNQQNTNVDERGSETEARLTPEDIDKLISERLNQTLTYKQQEENLNAVITEVTNVWGSDAKVRMNQVAKDVNMSLEQLQEIAKQNPTMFKRLIGLENKPTQTQRVPSSNTDPNRMVTGTQGTYKDYEKLRKENPVKYFSPEIQNEMFRKAKELGDKFYE